MNCHLRRNEHSSRVNRSDYFDHFLRRMVLSKDDCSLGVSGSLRFMRVMSALCPSKHSTSSCPFEACATTCMSDWPLMTATILADDGVIVDTQNAGATFHSYPAALRALPWQTSPGRMDYGYR